MFAPHGFVRRAASGLSLHVWILLGPGFLPTAAQSTLPQYLAQPDAWLASAEANVIAERILSHQSDLGGWPKGISTVAATFTGDRSSIRGTFDNGATTRELRFLGRLLALDPKPTQLAGFHRGLDHILAAQYPSGGWPQFFPPGNGYHRHITFNDDAMAHLLELLDDVAALPAYRFVDASRREAARRAFNRGVECILRCQIRVGHRPTVWCAQHDAINFEPRTGRSYELPSFSGAESTGLVRLLMRIEKPSPEIVNAIEGAVEWMEKARLKGIRVTTRKDPRHADRPDRVVIRDDLAPDLWARFYDLKTGRPIFCDRDGIPKSTLAEIGFERRNGYSWYGTGPQKLLEIDYPKWKARQAAK